MKKVIALSFILLANIILLAHAVIPHHDHENRTICFLDTHCTDSDVMHNHTDCDAQSHQDSTDSDRCCLIDIVFDPTDHKAKTFCHIHTQCDCLHTPYLLMSDVLELQDCGDDALLLFLYAPYIVTCHSDYISQSLGLRAPPYL